MSNVPHDCNDAACYCFNAGKADAALDAEAKIKALEAKLAELGKTADELAGAAEGALARGGQVNRWEMIATYAGSLTAEVLRGNLPDPVISWCLRANPSRVRVEVRIRRNDKTLAVYHDIAEWDLEHSVISPIRMGANVGFSIMRDLKKALDNAQG